MNMNREADGPLAGVRVLDLSSVVSVPLATMILGAPGAGVIKVEAAGSGDDAEASQIARAAGWG